MLTYNGINVSLILVRVPNHRPYRRAKGGAEISVVTLRPCSKSVFSLRLAVIAHATEPGVTGPVYRIGKQEVREKPPPAAEFAQHTMFFFLCKRLCQNASPEET
jgi:hypothetical protein